jgi:hypothetical protein
MMIMKNVENGKKKAIETDLTKPINNITEFSD